MIKRESRSKLSIKYDAVKRLLHWYCFSGIRPHFLVAEYPKSGGSWVSQLLSSYLQIPFPRNQSISLFQHTCLLHGHHIYSPLLKNAVYVMRDGRDIMVSAYFHLLFEHEIHAKGVVERYRNDLRFQDNADVYRNMPKFIEYMFTKHSRRFFHFSWAEFVNSINYEKAIVVKYEDLIEDTIEAISSVIEKLTQDVVERDRINAIVEKFAFRNQANRNPGDEDKSSFLRKGIAGDWKNKFSPESRKVFEHYGGEALIRAGYEPDSSWAQLASEIADINE